MNKWHDIAQRCGLLEGSEAKHHPHSTQERSELFHCRDGCSTEYEFLNLLNALVIATKPATILETGTFDGVGTVALASAARFNGVGFVITVDTEPCDHARNLCEELSLSPIVSFVQQDALEFCTRYSGDPFDFVFLDSGGTRQQECEALRNGKLSPNAVVVFHDASPYRSGTTSNSDCVEYLKTLPGGLRIWLSRGLEIHQFNA